MNLRAALILTVVISIFASCTRIDTTTIGSGLIPPVDNINTFDTTLEVITTNFYDTASVFPLRSDNLALGRINNDPLFGKTTGIVNLQLTPLNFPFRFNGIYDSLRLDSVVLVLNYRGVWGDSTTAQRLNVYEIAPNNLRVDTVYSSKSRIPHLPTLLGSATVDTRHLLRDSLRLYNEATAGRQIRIPITNNAFKERLFKDTTILDSARGFRAKIGGLAVVPDTAGFANSNNLLLINLSDPDTKLAFYYSFRFVGGTKRDTAASYFRFTSAGGYSNNIIRNLNGAEMAGSLAAGPDSLVYLQTRPESPFTRIRIPGLDDLRNRIVHRAELQVQQVRNDVTGTMDDYFSPPLLFLTAYSTDSMRRFMIPGGDVQFSNNGVGNLREFGAFPFRRTINGQPTTFYAFNLTRYVQGIATLKNRNYPLVLSAPFADYVYAVEGFNTLLPITNTGVVNPIATGRVRVGGGSHSTSRMRLRIIYTRI